MEEEIKIEADGKIDTTSAIKPSVVRLTRTYQSDIASAVKSGKGSLINIVMKEQEKRKTYEEKTSLKSGKNIFVLVFSFLLIVGGIGLISYFFYTKNFQKEVVVQKNSPINFIYANNQIKITLDKMDRREVILKIKEAKEDNPGQLGSITQFYFVKKDKEIELPLNTTSMLVSFLETRIPRDFLRFLENDFMFGTHSLSLDDEPFFIFKINSYEYAFANMLEWEQNLEDDLLPIFNPDPSLRMETRRIFKDLIIENRDVRAIIDDQEKIIFAYSFPDKNHLIFVNNEDTLKEIFLRLETSKLQKK